MLASSGVPPTMPSHSDDSQACLRSHSLPPLFSKNVDRHQRLPIWDSNGDLKQVGEILLQTSSPIQGIAETQAQHSSLEGLGLLGPIKWTLWGGGSKMEERQDTL